MKYIEDSRLAEDLLWRDVRIPRAASPIPALFLDRDGVMIEECNYLRDPDGVQLLRGIPDLIRAAKALGMVIVEITNQAGIAHGYLEWLDFVKVEDRVTEVLAKEGVSVDAAFACPFHPQGLAPYRQINHYWRKPNPGMLLEAKTLLNVDLGRSALIGDKALDLEAGRAAGLPLGIHSLTGYGVEQESASRALASQDFAVHVVRQADEAMPFLQKALGLPAPSLSSGARAASPRHPTD